MFSVVSVRQSVILSTGGRGPFQPWSYALFWTLTKTPHSLQDLEPQDMFKLVEPLLGLSITDKSRVPIK